MQMTKAKIIGAPHLFLNKRFSDWKKDCKTHMIPPVFKAKNLSSHQIGIKGSASITDKGDEGESIIYNLLKKLGDLRSIGMFVIHGFQLKEITNWNDKLKTKDFIVSKNGEFDFIIFHHKYGVISLEVKNYSNIKDSDAVPSAVRQLGISKEMIKKFATYDKVGDEDIDLPHTKVLAMPSTKKSEFSRGSLKEDIFLLFEDDCQNIDVFEKWWQETVETPTAVKLTQQTQVAYETALSYTLMIRHLSPVTEPEYMITLFNESLNGYTCHKYAAYQQILENEYPKFWDWSWRVLSKKDEGFDFGDEDDEEIKEAFMTYHRVKSEKDLRSIKFGVSLVNKLLKNNKYISGGAPSKIDEVMADLFAKNHFIFYEHILRFINHMRKIQTRLVEQGPITDTAILESYPFLKLQSYKELNKLDRYLSRSSFIKGPKPSILDLQLYETLTFQMAVKRSRLPMVLTSEQLSVFEGGLKQLIIGPPGSGKTDLLKFKAHELQLDMMKNKREKAKILYIVANGSSKYRNKESLFFGRIKEFFKKSSLVEVMTVILEEESSSDMECSITHLREKMNRYGHIFVDEYWIGSKPAEHKIILELLATIPGYVWISSVFDYSVQPIHADKISVRTGPLLAKLKESGGVVSRITTVLRASNNIIKLESRYSDIYSERSYPYGTKQMLGHSLEGLPVTWAVEEDVDRMYTRCVDIVESTVKDAFSLDAFRRDKMTFNPDGILVVDFAIRMDASVKQSLEELLHARNVPVLSLEGRSEEVTVRDTRKVNLLQSLTRDASSFLDGVEWPMVIVILPSAMLLNTAKLAKGAQKLRNYDPYISFFRTMVKLVVISDKWGNDDDFLTDVAQKPK